MNIFDQIGSAFASDFVSGPTVNPQYQPQQRTWVGLTEVEMKQTCYEVCSYDPYTIARAIEAKLKQKNT